MVTTTHSPPKKNKLTRSDVFDLVYFLLTRLACSAVLVASFGFLLYLLYPVILAMLPIVAFVSGVGFCAGGLAGEIGEQ